LVRLSFATQRLHDFLATGSDRGTRRADASQAEGGDLHSKSGVTAGRPSELGGTVEEPVEGTSPSHWTTHRPLRPPSLDHFSDPPGARRRLTPREQAHPVSASSARRTDTLRVFQGTGPVVSRADIGGCPLRRRRFRPVSCCVHGCGTCCTPESGSHDRAVPWRVRGAARSLWVLARPWVAPPRQSPLKALQHGMTIAL
jgi:hypothetical protein